MKNNNTIANASLLLAVGCLLGATQVMANEPPIISSITNQLTQMNAPIGPIPFTIGDAGTPAESLTLSTNSSNLSLVPTANIVFGGAGSNRTVTITPAPSRSGTSTITIGVSDGATTNSTSFVLTVNRPPEFQANNLLTVNRGGGGVVTSDLLRVGDVESGPGEIVYHIAPVGSGGPPHFGWLRLRGTNLVAGSQFTQQDINDGVLTYQHDDGCGFNDDFAFNFADGDGGSSGTGYYSFKINILPRDDAPVAIDDSAELSLGGSYSGTLSATNPDCLGQPLTFRILTNGIKGSLQLTNAGTGGFVYTANLGETGPDTVVFQVSDGGQDAASPGTFTLDLRNTQPTANAAAYEGNENQLLAGVVTGDDIDLPQQSLSFSVVSPPTKGTVDFTNATGGGFVYTPLPGRFGSDSFSFQANDGATNSAPAVITLALRPLVLPGRLVVGELGSQENSVSQSVNLIDPRTGDVGILSEAGYLNQPGGLAVEAAGTVLVADFGEGLLRIDPQSGAQAYVLSNSVLPNAIRVAVEADGNILVTGFGSGLARFSPEGILLTNFPAGNLQIPAAVAVAANGDILVTDAAAFGGMPEGTDIVRIHPVTLAQTVLSTNGLLAAPISLALETNGNLLIADSGSMMGGENRIIRVDPDDGSQTLLSSGGFLAQQIAVAVNESGEIFVSSQDGSFIQIDPVTGAQSKPALNGVFFSLNGITAVPGSLPPPAMSSITPTAGGYWIGFRGVPGRSYQLRRSTSFTSWTTLVLLQAPIDGLMYYEDTNAPAGSAFYRALME